MTEMSNISGELSMRRHVSGIWFLSFFFILIRFGFSEEIKEVESLQDFNSILAANQLVVADFFATWCPPCKALAPILHDIAADSQYSGKVAFVKVDVDKLSDLASQYEIGGIPDVRIFFKGKQINKLIGLQDKDEYVKAINEFL